MFPEVKGQPALNINKNKIVCQSNMLQNLRYTKFFLLLFISVLFDFLHLWGEGRLVSGDLFNLKNNKTNFYQ